MTSEMQDTKLKTTNVEDAVQAECARFATHNHNSSNHSDPYIVDKGLDSSNVVLTFAGVGFLSVLLLQ